MSRTTEDIIRAIGAGPLADFGKDVERDCIKFETLWSEPADGWAIASRAAARAMKEAGLPVYLHEWKPISDNINQEVMNEVRGLLRPEISKISHDVLAGKIVDWVNEDWYFHIFSTTLADAHIMAKHCLGPLLQMHRPVTLYTTFERVDLTGELGDELNKLDGMWVPCSSNLQALKDVGVENCTMIPFPYFDDDPHIQIPEKRGERKRFYWIGRWEPRKAPDRLVKAFLIAFKPGEAELTMKSSPIVWQAKWKSLDDTLHDAFEDPVVRANGWGPSNWRAGIQVITGRLSQEEMVKLHVDNDIYFSTSRGEGTDLPALQAKLSSNRLVTTDSGGPRDFIGSGDELIPMSGTVEADPMYKWGEGAAYADHDMSEIVAALQRARADTTSAAEWPKKNFHHTAVAAQFKAWVEMVMSK